MSSKNDNQNSNEEVNQNLDENLNENRGEHSEEDHFKKIPSCPYMNSCPMMFGAQMMQGQPIYSRNDTADSDGNDDFNFEGYRHRCHHHCYPCYTCYNPCYNSWIWPWAYQCNPCYYYRK